jgi:hypothetical protein
MSVTMKKALREIQRNVEKHTPVVERKLAKAGIQADPAVVFVAAQYYDTLQKLAKK